MDKWKDQPWKCSNCSFLLGVLSSDNTTLRIKWRDLFVTIVEAQQVKVICRRCGKENILAGEIPTESTKCEQLKARAL
jgi:hypothetical protein